MNATKSDIITLVGAIVIIGAGTAQAQELLTNKPAWLPQLSLGVNESYDDNIFGVSGIGMKPQRAWITKISPAIGFDFAPLLGAQAPFQRLSLNYTPDFAFFALPHVEAPYHEPSQNYYAHKFGTDIKGSSGDFSFSLDNVFLYNDGSKIAPTYALNQLPGAAGNQSDKYRDHYAYVPSEDRANQIEENETVILEYDLGPVFIRPTEWLRDVNMDTAWHKSSVAPYIGYQNFVDRSDVNGGLDLGYKVLTNVAVTVGYRYGSQIQQQFAPSVSSDYTNYSSSTYQRVLFGVEGKPWSWLQLKLDGGPDFRDYNSHTPINDLHPTKYYAEASLTATITAEQSLTFNYKQWQTVASTGFMPVWQSYYGLGYHWSATKRLALDLDAKIQEYDATGGTDIATGTDPSYRADRLYTLSPSVTYAFTHQLNASLSYTYNAGNNELYTLPVALHAAYRNYVDQIVSLGVSYKF